MWGSGGRKTQTQVTAEWKLFVYQKLTVTYSHVAEAANAIQASPATDMEMSGKHNRILSKEKGKLQMPQRKRKIKSRVTTAPVRWQLPGGLSCGSEDHTQVLGEGAGRQVSMPTQDEGCSLAQGKVGFWICHLLIVQSLEKLPHLCKRV